VLAHVRVDAGGDAVVDEPQLGHVHAVLAHDRRTEVDQALGVARLGAALEGAVDVGGLQAGEVVVIVHGGNSRGHDPAGQWLG